MKVNDYRESRESFSIYDVNPGQCFLFNDDLYIKIKPDTCGTDVAALKLETGEMIDIDDDVDNLIPVDAVVNIISSCKDNTK